jgi:hypothetical protein
VKNGDQGNRSIRAGMRERIVFEPPEVTVTVDMRGLPSVSAELLPDDDSA